MSDEIHVHAAAPGGGVHGELRGRDRVEIYFSTGFYDRTSESDLEHRLAGLFRQLWEDSRQARRARLQVHPDTSVVSETDRRFAEERDALLAEGRSDDGRITVTVEGLRRWRVRIAGDTLRTLPEHEFCAGAQTAMSRVITDQNAKAIQLRGRIYR